MQVRKIWATPEGEKHIAYCARVSNPGNQDNPDYAKLLKYCIKNGHWSIFEMASMCIEIETSRAISAQILRHKSFSFQEFSQRYAEVQEFEPVTARRQDDKNRQASHDDLSETDKQWFLDTNTEIQTLAMARYKEALARGIAKECARMLLPMAARTRLYMTGTVRSFIHWIQLRQANGTQKEHRDIALDAKQIFVGEFPLTAKALDWCEVAVA